MASNELVASPPRLFTNVSPKWARSRDCSRVGYDCAAVTPSPRVMLDRRRRRRRRGRMPPDGSVSGELRDCSVRRDLHQRKRPRAEERRHRFRAQRHLLRAGGHVGDGGGAAAHRRPPGLARDHHVHVGDGVIDGIHDPVRVLVVEDDRGHRGAGDGRGSGRRGRSTAPAAAGQEGGQGRPRRIDSPVGWSRAQAITGAGPQRSRPPPYNRSMGIVRAFGERGFVRLAAMPSISNAMARLADARLRPPILRRLINGYIRVYRVDMSEVAEPVELFPTFNHFFTRRLRAGARKVARGEGVVVAPADSRVSAVGSLPRAGRLDHIKGRSYEVEALLGSKEDAAAFAAGVHATLYLSPSMYHRVHSPVDGHGSSRGATSRTPLPRHALAVRHVPGLFAVNERVVVVIETREHGGWRWCWWGPRTSAASASPSPA